MLKSHIIYIYFLVDINPLEFVSTRNGTATFSCFPLVATNVVGIQWLVNGVLLDELELPNVETEFAILTSTRIGTLTFSRISPDQNMTSIRCRAMFRSGGLSALSRNSTLLLQGDYCVHMNG